MAENPVTASAVKVVGDQLDTVAASQTARILGAGLTGGYISHIVIVPETTSPGSVALLDGGNSNTVFAGGASSVSNLCPFAVPINAYAVGAWKITTGANVHVLAVGRFG